MGEKNSSRADGGKNNLKMERGRFECFFECRGGKNRWEKCVFCLPGGDRSRMLRESNAHGKLGRVFVAVNEIIIKKNVVVVVGEKRGGVSCFLFFVEVFC